MMSLLQPITRLLALFGISASIFTASGCGREENGMSGDERIYGTDDLYLSPSSEEDARIAGILPTKGSEDVRSILGKIHSSRTEANSDEEVEYLPDETTEWVLDVQFPNSTPIDARTLAELFSKKSFGALHGSTSTYGKDAATNRWTFLVSADGPKTVTGLKVAWDYFTSWNEDAKVTSVREYEARIVAVKDQLKELVGEVEVHLSAEPNEAAARSESLSTLSERFDRHVAFYLVAPKPATFSGKDIWDVMLCLGLQWGDMDCFHWVNDSGIGDDYYFSIETSTPPGYFLPERIAAGKLKTKDLIFVFSVPRTAEPVMVADRMEKAAQYARSRLGGEIVYTIGDKESDRDSVMKEIEAIAKALKELGFEPGSDTALRFF